MIMNPPSAWAVAKRDAPQVAEQCWTHGFPVGPKGRFAPFLPYFWSVWSFSKNKEAAKSLLMHLSQPASIEKLVTASGGYDLPAWEKLTTLKTWAEEGPPKGTLFHYPNPFKHQTLSIAASPAPPKIAQQIYTQATLTKMCVRFYQGEAMEKTLAWAEGELRRLYAELKKDFAQRPRNRPRGRCDEIRSVQPRSGGRPRSRLAIATIRECRMPAPETGEEDASWLMSRFSRTAWLLRERRESVPACGPP